MTAPQSTSNAPTDTGKLLGLIFLGLIALGVLMLAYQLVYVPQRDIAIQQNEQREAEREAAALQVKQEEEILRLAKENPVVKAEMLLRGGANGEKSKLRLGTISDLKKERYHWTRLKEYKKISVQKQILFLEYGIPKTNNPGAPVMGRSLIIYKDGRNKWKLLLYPRPNIDL